MAVDDPWVEAVGIWVRLKDLVVTVERETEIPQAEAVRVLRPALESGLILAEVVGWPDRVDGSLEEWAVVERIDDPERVSPEGWQHVDWKSGTLNDYQIRVRWADVKQALNQSAIKLRLELHKISGQRADPSVSGVAGATAIEPPMRRSGGGAPPKHDWEAFWIEVALFAEKNELDPTHRSELQKHMVDWTAGTSLKPPDEATIRSRLARLYKARAAEQS